jgi:hypothetical protein
VPDYGQAEASRASSLWDFVIHLVGKLLVVVVSGFLVPSLIVLALFFVLRWGQFDRTAVYFGEFALIVALGFCLVQGFGFNSKRMIRRMCANRGQPLFRYRHPIVRDALNGDTLSGRILPAPRAKKMERSDVMFSEIITHPRYDVVAPSRSIARNWLGLWLVRHTLVASGHKSLLGWPEVIAILGHSRGYFV